jgi:hypothetical protein
MEKRDFNCNGSSDDNVYDDNDDDDSQGRLCP